MRVAAVRRLHGLQRLNPHPSVAEPFAYKQAQPSGTLVVAMSSGVDSSVTAALMAQRHGKAHVKGVYMANWLQDAKCTEGEWSDVQRVCEQIGIDCERVNFEKEYWHDVFAPMLAMYERGLTPNPDMGCNRYVKFGVMVQHLQRRLGNQWWLATGHYARIEPSVYPRLIRGYDGNKDQSYYLANVENSVLHRVLMPLGHYTKPQVRQMAAQMKLHTASKPDSQGLCFVSPTGSFRDFLNEYLPQNPGNIVTEDGRVWAQHQGLWHATVGQKAGITMPQGDPRYKGVWFVSEKRIAENELVIVKGGDNPALFKKRLSVEDWLWMGDGAAHAHGDLSIQYRSLQDPVLVESMTIDDTVHFTLKQAQRAMAPGQSVVLYKGNRVLGAGTLASTFT